MDEKKPIDYIPEPDRQEILDTMKGIDQLKLELKTRREKFESEPHRNLTTSDMTDFISIMEKLSLQLSITFQQIILLEAHYFKDKEDSKPN